MSARRVCRGSWPWRYHSDRAISAPFRRPPTRTLMPRAPNRSADSTAFRIARRNATRFSSCSATDSPISWAFELGLLDLLDVDEDLPPGALLDLVLELVDLGPLATDDDAGTRGVDVELEVVRRPLDLDLRDPGVREPLLELGLQGEVFMQQLGVVAIGVPTRAPGLVEAQPEPIRVNLLSHASSFSPDRGYAPVRLGRQSWPWSSPSVVSSSPTRVTPTGAACSGRSRTITVRCDVRLMMRNARPIGAARIRFSDGP